MDVTCVILSLPLVLPVTLVVMAVIKLVSKGPVLFTQERVGLGRSRFRCFKFRTMNPGVDSLAHREHTAELMNSSKPWAKLDGADPRVIPLGGLLRATGLDELPQLLNVVRGEMSLVGPRPCTSYELERYLPWQMERFDALPGLTGLWQVSGKNRTTFTEMIRLDIDYVRMTSLALDMKIILKTIPALLDQVSDTFILKQIRSSPVHTQPRNAEQASSEKHRPNGSHRLSIQGTEPEEHPPDPCLMPDENGARRQSLSAGAHSNRLSPDEGLP
jgi:lipopolysaccharide/colanic/teichoic acid biosynthesis glycosyltransferase